jgi:hypothetical protein
MIYSKITGIFMIFDVHDTYELAHPSLFLFLFGFIWSSSYQNLGFQFGCMYNVTLMLCVWRENCPHKHTNGF